MEKRFKENISKIDDEAFSDVTVSKTTFPSHSQIDEVISEITNITKLATKIPAGTSYRDCCDDFLSFAKSVGGFKYFVVGETNDEGITSSYKTLNSLKTVYAYSLFHSFDSSMKVIDGLRHEVSLKEHGYNTTNDLNDVTKLITYLNLSVLDISRHLVTVRNKIPENLLTDDGGLILSQCVKTSSKAMSVFLGLIGRLTRQLSVVYTDLISAQKYYAKYAI